VSGLEKARLIPLTAGARPTPRTDRAVKVQFNPSSLRLQLSSNLDGGQTVGHQDKRFLGTSPATLSFDLVFDTADEGTTGAPRDVRARTTQVTRFMLPEQLGGAKQTQPPVRFTWGTFVFDGVMTSATEDIDLFSEGGVPLRAKVSVSLREQNAALIARELGPGAADGAAATAATSTGAGPGTIGIGGELSIGALGGESAAELAARVGLAPAAWRGLDLGGASPLDLQAGLQVDFSAGLTARAGIGLTTGVEAGASVSLEASFGLDVAAGAEAAASAGFALAAAGGVRAALESVSIARADAAVAQARSAFVAAPAEPSAPRPGPPAQPRQSLARSGGAPEPAFAAPAPPRADTRATTFGAGVPLRPRAGGSVQQGDSATRGWVAVPRRERDPREVPLTRDPAAPPWAELPVARATAAASLTGGGDCGCGGGCGGAR
jgi:hypothetical protein